MFLQQTFCYQVLFKWGSSALLLLTLLMGKRNICLFHGDLLIPSICGNQGFVASISLSEILAAFSSVSPVSVRIENSLTLGLPEKIKMYSLSVYPQNLLSPCDAFFQHYCTSSEAHFGINQAKDVLKYIAFPGRILLKEHQRWDTPTPPTEIQGE